MKKILFAAHSLDIGGIEKALVMLLNELVKKDYQITLVLEKNEGIFLKDLDSKISVITYTPDNSSNVIIRKIKNLCKRIKFILKYKNKFDFSASFATYSNSSAFVARNASKNSCLWCHADYMSLFEGDIFKIKNFFEEKNFEKFKNYIFVSEEGKNSFVKVFPMFKDKVIVCNNLINAEKIKEMSLEKINFDKGEKITFLNVGRHDEKQKKLSRIIESAKMLKNDKYDFQILFIGDGPDRRKYEEMVEKNDLTDNIKFLGKKENPYPYFKISDCVILSSDYEGYPVVFLESKILKKPIITTDVSDYQDIDGKFGYVTKKDVKNIYEKMKEIIEKGFDYKYKFNDEKYNNEIIEKIQKLIERK